MLSKITSGQKKAIVVMSILLLCNTGSSAYATDLNGVSKPKTETQTQNQTQTVQEPQQTQQAPVNQGSNSDSLLNSEPSKSNKESAEAVSDIFGNASVDKESAEKASSFTRPFAKVMNTVFAIILGLASAGLLVTTGLDLLVIAVPFSRKFLAPDLEQSGSSGGFGGGMGGMGGYGGGMGGSTGGQSHGFRLISDEAKEVLSASGGSQGMAGGFGGGFGGGGFGGGQQQAPTKLKVLEYLKKRTVMLVVFGICVLLFSTTVFTDLGIKLGTWLLGVVTGVTNSIPS